MHTSEYSDSVWRMCLSPRMVERRCHLPARLCTTLVEIEQFAFQGREEAFAHGVDAPISVK